MAQNKTQPMDASVDAYLAGVEPAQKRADAQALDALFRRVTGWKPILWGASPASAMVGYGRYTYTYKTGHGGTFFATGFAPRKTNLSVYIMPGYQDYGAMLARLGKHKNGKSCLYINKLADVDESVLGELIATGVSDLGKLYPVEPT